MCQQQAAGKQLGLGQQNNRWGLGRLHEARLQLVLLYPPLRKDRQVSHEAYRLRKRQDPPQFERNSAVQRRGAQAQPIAADQPSAGQQIQEANIQGQMRIYIIEKIELHPQPGRVLHREPFLVVRGSCLDSEFHKYRQAVEHLPVPLLPRVFEDYEQVAVTADDPIVRQQALLCEQGQGHLLVLVVHQEGVQDHQRGTERSGVIAQEQTHHGRDPHPQRHQVQVCAFRGLGTDPLNSNHSPLNAAQALVP